MVILLSVILTMIITPDPNGLGENDRFRAEMSDMDASQTQTDVFRFDTVY